MKVIMRILFAAALSLVLVTQISTHKAWAQDEIPANAKELLDKADKIISDYRKKSKKSRIYDLSAAHRTVAAGSARRTTL
jgi:hypothetical protein